ncbi:uncharacterized protein LOC119766355 [Culex quinquefasciatus]|uniref:uncharacterized protein LOC119766355 n=1 Tax=Culex quinquefasciatus TaxID=7176 RepID=UPI0018E3C168|nr:uncharacterized protein LOC119766355 [Culex quinquefasciatus]
MGRRLCGCEFAPVVFDKVKFSGEDKDPTEEGNDEKRSEVVSADFAIGAGGLRPSAALCAGSDDGTVWDVLRIRSPFLVLEEPSVRKPQVLKLSYSDYFQRLERYPTNLIKNIYLEYRRSHRNSARKLSTRDGAASAG